MKIKMGNCEMQKDVAERLGALPEQGEGAFVIYRQGNVVAMSVTAKPKRDIAKAMWEESCGDFLFKQGNPEWQVERWQMRMPGVKVIKAKLKRERQPLKRHDPDGSANLKIGMLARAQVGEGRAVIGRIVGEMFQGKCWVLQLRNKEEIWNKAHCIPAKQLGGPKHGK